jgi:hypothetical protein
LPVKLVQEARPTKTSKVRIERSAIIIYLLK